jgi:hypothetical protein
MPSLQEKIKILSKSDYTDKKEIKVFSFRVEQLQMRKGFLIYEEMRKYFPIYEEAVSHI